MIIIPTFNEKNNIRPLLARIRKILPYISILFVDDASPDGTAEEVRELQAQDKNIYLLSRASKLGFASAYIEGFKKAFSEFNPTYIVTMDADLSHPAEKLPELIAEAEKGRVAIGSRYAGLGKVENWSWYRSLLSRLGNIYAKILTRLPISDLTSGFIAIPANKLRRINLESIKSRGYAYQIELKQKLADLKCEFVEVPIIFEDRKFGKSKISRSIIWEGIIYPLKIFFLRQITVNYPAWLVFLISLTVYAFTLPHSIFFGDSSEFVASAATLGIPHPSGYPTYVLLSKLFTFLPFGNLEYRIGLFSAFCASLSLVLFYFLCVKYTGNKFLAFTSALILAFSDLFWSQAIMAKVYAPLVLIVLAIVFLLIKFLETRNKVFLFSSAFLFGIGGGIHLIVWLLLPLMVYVLIIQILRSRDLKTYWSNFSLIFGSCLMFALGFGVFAFLIFRSRMSGNFFNFPVLFDASRPAGSFTGFWHYILRSDYADLAGKILWHDKFIFLASSMAELWRQFYWLLGFALIGLIWLWRHRHVFAITVGVFLLNILGLLLLRASTWNFETDWVYSYYYLTAFVMVALWICFGLFWTFSKLPKNLTWLLASLPILFFAGNLTKNNLRHFDFVQNYTQAVLANLPTNSVLLLNYPGGNTDTITFGLLYQQIVNHLRPDVTLLTVYQMYPHIDRKTLTYVYGKDDPRESRLQLTNYALKYFGDRPIYTTYLVDDLPPNKLWTEVSNGLAYELVPDRNKMPAALPGITLNYQKDLPILENDQLYGHDLLAEYFYTQAAYWVGQLNLPSAQKNFIDGIKYDYKAGGIDQKAFIYFRGRSFGKQ